MVSQRIVRFAATLLVVILTTNLGFSQDKLDGVWEVASVIDDGQMLSAKTVKETFLKDGRLTIQGQILQFTAPNGTLRVKTFVTDPKANPKTLDLANTDKVGSKGIYLLEDDNLIICLCGGPGQPRPTAFVSRAGQDTTLLSLRRVQGAAPAVTPPAAPPAPPARKSDDDMRKALVGTWGHQDEKSVQRITLNADGTFSVLTTWKSGFKRLFDSEDRSSGRWVLKDGQVTMTMTANSEREKIGQVYSYTITNLLPSEVLYVDNQTGGRRIEWRIQ